MKSSEMEDGAATGMRSPAISLLDRHASLHLKKAQGPGHLTLFFYAHSG